MEFVPSFPSNPASFVTFGLRSTVGDDSILRLGLEALNRSLKQGHCIVHSIRLHEVFFSTNNFLPLSSALRSPHNSIQLLQMEHPGSQMGHLEYEWTPFNLHVMRELCTVLLLEDCRLTELALLHYGLDDEALTMLFSGIKYGNAPIRKLGLTGNAMSTPGVRALCDLLEHRGRAGPFHYLGPHEDGIELSDPSMLRDYSSWDCCHRSGPWRWSCFRSQTRLARKHMRCGKLG
jgi:hypothetical protein